MDGYLQNGDCHRFTDDVALCYANSLEEADGIFCKLYITELVVVMSKKPILINLAFVFALIINKKH